MTALTYTTAKVQTPKRDVDLFGPTTVRVDGRPEGGEPFPVAYLSAYVPDPERAAGRIAAALAWLDDTQDRAKPAPEASAYTMPEFVEDVDYSEVLFLPDEPAATDWKGWTEAMIRRVRLATTAGQIALLLSANAAGARLCPPRFRSAFGKALLEAQDVTHDQSAAA